MQDSSVESITENMLGSQTLDAEYWGPGEESEPNRLLPVLPYRTQNACEICANKNVIIVLIVSNTICSIWVMAMARDLGDGEELEIVVIELDGQPRTCPDYMQDGEIITTSLVTSQTAILSDVQKTRHLMNIAAPTTFLIRRIAAKKLDCREIWRNTNIETKGRHIAHEGK